MSNELVFEIAIEDWKVTPERAQEITLFSLELAMHRAVAIVTDEVVPLTPMAFGFLRNSIAQGHEVTVQNPNVFGKVSSPLSYALPVETGSRPHWAPIGPLKLWAKRILGDEAAAYAVQWAIARRGTKGWFMFKKGFAQAKPKVERWFAQVTQEIIDKLKSI